MDRLPFLCFLIILPVVPEFSFFVNVVMFFPSFIIVIRLTATFEFNYNSI